MPKHHKLKTHPPYFANVKAGIKKFELRENDRDFKAGDSVELLEFHDGAYTGESIPLLTIQYVFYGDGKGLNKGHCIFCWE